MLSKEHLLHAQEEPFLRTKTGKLAVTLLSISMILASLSIAEATKKTPQEEYFDPNREPTDISISDEEMKRFLVTPKPIEEIPIIKDMEHVIPEEIEKQLKK